MEKENLLILEMVAHEQISVNEALDLIEVLQAERCLFCPDEPLTIEVSLS